MKKRRSNSPPPPSKYFVRRVLDDCAAWGPFLFLLGIFFVIHAILNRGFDELWKLIFGCYPW